MGSSSVLQISALTITAVLPLGREPEDLECVEGCGEGDLLWRLLEVGRDHLHRDGQRARLVPLESAVALQERLRPEKLTN